MPQINPTRINLINLRKSAVQARKGYDILKKKREVLVMEFLKLLKQSKTGRSKLYAILSDAYERVKIANVYVGNFELEEMAMQINKRNPIGMRIKNIMGVKIPEIEKAEAETLPYNLLSTNAAVDDVNSAFTEVINSIIDVAQMEQGLKKLVMEIDKTKRRVNALDYVVIPRMKAQEKYIAMRLEELDRDTFSALKHTKKKLERENA
jgi:V/A-type H+-transporting ATPase subunit D